MKHLINTPKALWINTSQRYYKEINEQLREIGIQKNKVIVYLNKSYSYFNLLEERYIRYEEKQLDLKRSGKLTDEDWCGK